jgi:hypothetical protein
MGFERGPVKTQMQDMELSRCCAVLLLGVNGLTGNSLNR